jgi:anti-sigma regulatory factor (Ser/Thr protein kinase)
MTVAREFTAEPNSVTDARHFVVAALHGIDEEISDAAALMASELATNSVRHAATTFRVTVDCTPDRLTVAVEDAGPGTPVVRTPTPEEPTGRGLQIVDALADDWGVTARASGAKAVWFVLAIDGFSAERFESTD